jgi:hypothetical protein
MAFFNRYQSFNPADDSDKGWNLAQLFCNRLDSVSGLIDESLKVNDLTAVYRLLKRIFSKISYLILKKKDKILFDKTYLDYYDELNDKFKKLHQLINSKQAEMNIGIIQMELEKVDEQLYWLQWDLNLIFPEEKHKSWEDELKEEFE